MTDATLSRRQLIGTAALAGAAAILPWELAAQAPPPATAGGAGFSIVTSANGLEAAKAARQALVQGKDPLDAAIAGVNVVELDPDDMTVGYGGIPNEDGVVELDAAVMDGRTMRAGAVGALTGVKTPSKVARLVMDQTDRVFLVGAGARRFATAHGFADEDLLTEKTRKIWLHWKNRLSDLDDWIEAARDAERPGREALPREVREGDLSPAGDDPPVGPVGEGRPRRRHDDLGPLLQDPRPRRRLARDRRRPLLRERRRVGRVDRPRRGEPPHLRLPHGRRVPAQTASPQRRPASAP